jgi:hypothetical protein
VYHHRSGPGEVLYGAAVVYVAGLLARSVAYCG